MQGEAVPEMALETEKFAAADEDHDELLSATEVEHLLQPSPAVLEVLVRDILRHKDRDRDGRLSAGEFWEQDGSDDELEDFQELDRDQDGFLTTEELRSWESGQFHTEGAMERLLRIADGDGDGAVTAGELEAAQDTLRQRDAHFYLTEWAAHHEL